MYDSDSAQPGSSPVLPTGETGELVVEMTGLSRSARAVLANQPLAVLHFPFSVGRASRSTSVVSRHRDLLLPDWPPFCVSRQHLTIDRVGGRIVIVDDSSTCGTLVGDVCLGPRSGRTRLELEPGRHIIAVGGEASSYHFRFDVRPIRVGDYAALDQPRPDRLPQARMLYQALCRHTTGVLADPDMGADIRASKAEELARALVGRDDLMDMLRTLAANPIVTDDHVVRHSMNVAIYSAVLFGQLDYRVEDRVKAVAGTLLHDIGMYAVDPAILSKKGPLSPEELEIVKSHTVTGSELLTGRSDVAALAADIAREHHERSDGSGYPGGMRLYSETSALLGIADSFEALTHDRPHRPALAPSDAVKVIVNRCGSVYGRESCRAFVNAFSFFPIATLVKLSSGLVGQVIATEPGKPLSPKVRVLLDRNGRPVTEETIIELDGSPGQRVVDTVTDRGFAQRCLA